jgi:hypothetical protein
MPEVKFKSMPEDDSFPLREATTGYYVIAHSHVDSYIPPDSMIAVCDDRVMFLGRQPDLKSSQLKDFPEQWRVRPMRPGESLVCEEPT